MIIIAAISLAIIFALVTIGIPLATLLVNKLFSHENQKLSLLLAVSLVAGFFISTLAAGWSYGFVGTSTYIYFVFAITLISWVVLFALRHFKDFLRIIRNANKSELFLLFVPPLALFLTRPQFQNFTNPQIRSGDGPDTMQNLMAALAANDLGKNWFEQASNIVNYFGNSSLRETVFNLYQYPSFRSQAGFDYLVYGTRWGLSVPMSQLIKHVGSYTVLWETGFVLTVSLTAIGIIGFAVAELINMNLIMRFSVTILVMCNAPFLYQVFNGGLSQAWATPAIIGMSLFIYGILFQQVDKKSLKYWAILQTMIFVILIGTYVDAAIIYLLLLGILILFTWVKHKEKSLLILKSSVSSLLIALFISPVLTYATLLTFDLRLKAAQGTGIASKIWPFPSEMLGMINVLSPNQTSRSPEILLLALLLTGYVLYSLARIYINKDPVDHAISLIGISALIVMGIGFLLSYTGKLKTDYIYMKMSAYVSYLVIIAFAYSLFPRKSKIPVKKTKSFGFVLIIFTLFSLVTATSATAELNKTGTVIPYEFKPLFENKKIQTELSKYNYLTTYIPGANYLGVFGDVHWISKAPNDQVLKDRVEIELRLICFSADANCKPSTQRISNPELEKFGLITFQSPITTKEFVALSIKDRYKVNFEVFGIPPQEIPERFLGGNPYYNKGK